jgi:folylpolyglutamate synthase/dihydropteroate synthase
LCPVVDVIVDVGEAVAVAVRRARADGGAVVVTGSLFVVGEARAVFITMPKDPVRPAW